MYTLILYWNLRYMFSIWTKMMKRERENQYNRKSVEPSKKYILKCGVFVERLKKSTRMKACWTKSEWTIRQKLRIWRQASDNFFCYCMRSSRSTVFSISLSLFKTELNFFHSFTIIKYLQNGRFSGKPGNYRINQVAIDIFSSINK